MSEGVTDPIASTELVQHIHLGRGEEASTKDILREPELQSGPEETDKEFVEVHGSDVIHTVYHLLQTITLKISRTSCGYGRRRRENNGERKMVQEKVKGITLWLAALD